MITYLSEGYFGLSGSSNVSLSEIFELFLGPWLPARTAPCRIGLNCGYTNVSRSVVEECPFRGFACSSSHSSRTSLAKYMMYCLFSGFDP